MQAVTYPFRIDHQGHLAVATTYDEVVRSQLIDVLMTNHMERVMRPTYGANLRAALHDPVDELVRSDAASQVRKSVDTWTPRAIIQALQFTDDVLRPTTLLLDVSYRTGVFDQATQLRLPVSRFLTEESEI